MDKFEVFKIAIKAIESECTSYSEQGICCFCLYCDESDVNIIHLEIKHKENCKGQEAIAKLKEMIKE